MNDSIPDSVVIQRNRTFYLLLTVGVVGGVLFIVIAETLGVSGTAKDIVLVVGGALIGLVSLAVDEALRAGPDRRKADHQLRGLQDVVTKGERRDVLMSQPEINNAYHLGYAASMMRVTLSPDEYAEHAAKCSSNLRFTFSPAEWRYSEPQSAMPTGRERHARSW